MSIKVLTANKDELVFDIVGVDLAIVNALRRILIAEVFLLVFYFIFLCVYLLFRYQLFV